MQSHKKLNFSRKSSMKSSSSEAVEPGLSSHSVKMISEIQGIATISDTATQYVSDHVTLILRSIIQDSLKHMKCGKRNYLTTKDLDSTLLNKGFEAIYGSSVNQVATFQYTRGGGRDIYFSNESDIDLKTLMNQEPSKVPYECSIRSHWLVVEGRQPAVPENPAPRSIDEYDLESQGGDTQTPGYKSNEKKTSYLELKPRTLRDLISGHSKINPSNSHRSAPELALVKEIRTHDLATEQQIYFREITEACVGSVEERRQEALGSLSADSGLNQLLPRLITFISEGVRANTLSVNLAILIYLMRMIQCLLENPHLNLEMYLHRLLPTILSCIVCRQLCIRPDQDNHWALRDFAAKQLTVICNKYSTSTNRLLSSVTDLLLRALFIQDSPASSSPNLVTMYGSLVALCSLGNLTIKNFVLPVLPTISTKISEIIDPQGSNVSHADQKALQNLKTVFTSRIAAVLSDERRGPLGSIESYRSEFGCMGLTLHSGIVSHRNSANTTATTTTSTATPQSSTVSNTVVSTAVASASSIVVSQQYGTSSIVNPIQISSANTIPLSNVLLTRFSTQRNDL